MSPELADREWATIVVPDQLSDGSIVYVARHPELPGCMSHGSTPDEARENLADARELYLEDVAISDVPPAPSESTPWVSSIEIRVVTEIPSERSPKYRAPWVHDARAAC